MELKVGEWFFMLGIDPEYDKRFWHDEQPRTKQTHPYSYDSHTTWKSKSEPLGDSTADLTVWTDHFYREDPVKHDIMCKKYFGETGHYWSNRKPKLIEQMFSEHFGKELKLMRIMEHCNQSSGFPLWSLHFKEVKMIKQRPPKKMSEAERVEQALKNSKAIQGE